MWFKKNKSSLFLCILIATILELGSTWLKTDYLATFLDENLLLILPALLAINIATITVILSKISDFRKSFPAVTFDTPIKAMRNSIIEQVVMLCIAVCCLSVKHSTLTIFTHPVIRSILQTLIFFGATFSIQILMDTSIALFKYVLVEDNTYNVEVT